MLGEHSSLLFYLISQVLVTRLQEVLTVHRTRSKIVKNNSYVAADLT